MTPPARARRGSSEDDVAVLLDPVAESGQVSLGSEDGVIARQAIPAFHKIALRPIAEGSKVRRKGVAIGRATRDIQAGDHVHIHNIVSLRS